MKYYIVKITPLFPPSSIWYKTYKQYKCSDGFSPNKHICWKFTKQGATKILDRLQREYQNRNSPCSFYLEEVSE